MSALAQARRETVEALGLVASVLDQLDKGEGAGGVLEYPSKAVDVMVAALDRVSRLIVEIDRASRLGGGA